MAIVESDEDERGIFNFIHTTRGINTYMTALNELSLKYGHVPLTKLDENNIQMYNPCDYSSGEEEQQDAIAPDTDKPPKTSQFIDDEAAVDHDDQDKDNVNDAEVEEEAGANKWPSDDDNEQDTDDGEQEENDEDEKEAEVNERPRLSSMWRTI